MELLNVNSLNNKIKSFSEFSSIVISLIGFIFLIGWLLNIPILITPNPNYASVALTSSICFILIGISIFLLQEKRINPQNKKITYILSLIILSIGLFTILDYILNYINGISLMEPIVGFQNLIIVKMSISAAISFISIGITILIIDNQLLNKYNFYLMFIVFFVMYLIILGYIYQTNIYNVFNTTQPSLYGAITFIVIALSVICSRPNRGITKILISDSLSGIFGRRLLPAVIVLPVIMGELRLLGQELGLYDFRFGIALLVFSTAVILFIIVVGSMLSLNRIDMGRLKAEYDLKESRMSFKSLAEHSPDIITRYDTNFRIMYINRSFPVVDLSQKSFIGKNSSEVGITKENVRIWTENLNKALITGKNQRMEFKFPGINGIRTFSSIITPEYNNKGQITSLLGISRDITSRKQAEEELKKTVENLRRSNEELQQFTYITSHDLQEPLRTIASYAQLIERRYKGKLDNDADEFLEFMINGAKRMKQQIQGLLDYSHIGTCGEKFRKFNSEEAFSHALNNLRSIIIENNAEITYDPLPVIYADENQIESVFQNLIGNALKFRKEGMQPEIHISSKIEDNEYVFSISDNGMGFEEQYSDQIFKVFKRLHAIGDYEGVGIGLAIVKRIIDRHGGHIWVKSKLGFGSTFYFTIPIKK